MEEAGKRPLEGKDKAGVMLLVGLLTAAFIPSLFISFDLSGLAACLESTPARRAQSVALFLPAGAGDSSLPGDCESSALFLVSVEADTECSAPLPSGLGCGSPFPSRQAGATRFPPDTLPPQRAPPPA